MTLSFRCCLRVCFFWPCCLAGPFRAFGITGFGQLPARLFVHFVFGKHSRTGRSFYEQRPLVRIAVRCLDMRVIALLSLLFGFIGLMLLDGQTFTHAVEGIVCGIAAVTCGLLSVSRDHANATCRWEGRIMAALGLVLALFCVVQLPSAHRRQTKFNERSQKVPPFIYVRGEFRAPGPYPWTNGMTLKDSFAAAGGFTDFAVPRVRLEHWDGSSQRYQWSSTQPLTNNPVLKPGDKVINLRE